MATDTLKDIDVDQQKSEEKLLSGWENQLSISSKIDDTDFLNRSKEDILKTLKLIPKQPKTKKTISKESLATLPISQRIQYTLNNINDLLKWAFKETISEEYIKKNYTEWYLRLPDFSTKPIEDWYYKVLVSNVHKGGLVVCLGKKWKAPVKLPISQKDLLGKNYLRADEIVVKLQKNGDEFHLQEVDKRYYDLQTKWLLDKELEYSPLWSEKIIKGSIIGLGKDVSDEEVIFQPKKGTQFSLKLHTLLDGMKKVTTLKKWEQGKPTGDKGKNKQVKKIILIPKKPTDTKQSPHEKPTNKEVYNWFNNREPKVHNPPRGRDGEKIIY